MKSKEILIENVLGDGFVMLNKRLVQALGDREAMMVGYLVDKRRYWRSENRLQDDGSFYWAGEEIQETLGWTDEMRIKIQKKLTSSGVLTVIKRGLPCKNFYLINDGMLVDILSTETTATKMPGTSTLENQGTGTLENQGELKNPEPKKSEEEKPASSGKQSQEKATNPEAATNSSSRIEEDEASTTSPRTAEEVLRDAFGCHTDILTSTMSKLPLWTEIASEMLSTGISASTLTRQVEKLVQTVFGLRPKKSEWYADVCSILKTAIATADNQAKAPKQKHVKVVVVDDLEVSI